MQKSNLATRFHVQRLDLLSRIQREWSMIRGRQQHGSKHTVDQTPEPAPQLVVAFPLEQVCGTYPILLLADTEVAAFPQEGSPVGCLVVISARIVDFPSLAETLTELQLVCVLDQLYKKLEKLRKNGNLTAISWTGLS